MPLDDATRQGEPEPCTLAFGLGREERLENPRLNLRKNPGTGVGDLDARSSALNLVACGKAQPARRRSFSQRLARGRDEVQYDLLQLVPVGPHQRQVALEVKLNVDVVDPKLEGQQLHRVPQKLGQHHAPPLRRAAPGHRQEAPHDAHAALRGLLDVAGSCADAVVGRRGGKQSGLSEDDRQGAAELMRDAGQKVIHRRQLFRLEKLVRALLDLRLQRLVLAAKIAVEKPYLQQVAHAEKQFGLFEGLGHVIACARLERRALAGTRHVGGQDKHR